MKFLSVIINSVLYFIPATQQENTQPLLSPSTPANNMVNNNINNAQQLDSDGRYHGTELVMLYDYKVCTIMQKTLQFRK